MFQLNYRDPLCALSLTTYNTVIDGVTAKDRGQLNPGRGGVSLSLSCQVSEWDSQSQR